MVWMDAGAADSVMLVGTRVYIPGSRPIFQLFFPVREIGKSRDWLFTFLKQIMGKYMKKLYINYQIAKKKLLTNM